MIRIFKIIGGILFLIASYVLLQVLIQGIRVVFSSEKVYIKYGEDTYHSTPYCPRLGVDETDIDYMRETGDLIKSEEYPKSEARNDLALNMCPYCFSLYDVKKRFDYYKNAYGERYEEKVNEAKKLRKEKRLKQLKEDHPDWFK